MQCIHAHFWNHVAAMQPPQSSAYTSSPSCLSTTHATQMHRPYVGAACMLATPDKRQAVGWMQMKSNVFRCDRVDSMHRPCLWQGHSLVSSLRNAPSRWEAMPGPPVGALCRSCSAHSRTARFEDAHDLAEKGVAACRAALRKARGPVPGPTASVLHGGLVA